MSLTIPDGFTVKIDDPRIRIKPGAKFPRGRFMFGIAGHADSPEPPIAITMH